MISYLEFCFDLFSRIIAQCGNKATKQLTKQLKIPFHPYPTVFQKYGENYEE